MNYCENDLLMHICTRLDVEMFDPAAGYSKLQMAALAGGLQIYHDG